MDLNLLNDDELGIEFLVRGLQSNQEGALSQLKAQIDLEKVTSVLIPKRPHEAARKSPRREIKFCGAKFIAFQEWMKLNVENADGNEWAKLRSRVLHVIGRLKRMSYSPSVKMDVDKLLLDGQKLLEFIDHSVEERAAQDIREDLNNLTIELNELDDFDLGDYPNVQSTIIPGSQSEVGAMSQVRVNAVAGPNVLPVDRNFYLNSEPSTSQGNPAVRFAHSDQNSSRRDDFERLRTLLASQDLDQLTEILNEVILTKTALLSTQELQNIELLNNMSTPPSRTPNKLFVPSRPIPNIRDSNAESSVTFAQHSTVPPNFSQPPPIGTDIQPPANLNETFGAPSTLHNFLAKNQRFSSFLKRDPSTWGLTFHGSSKDPPIENFVFRVESIAVGVFRVNLDQLVNEFCAFLKDNAQTWYWTYRQRYANQQISYAQFKRDLISRFRDSRTDFDIRYLISNRKQNHRENEEFRRFYDEVLQLVARLKVPMSDAELLELVRRNMRPGLQILLASKQFESLDELVAQCVSLETMFNRIGYNPEANMQYKRVISEIQNEGVVCEPLSQNFNLETFNVPKDHQNVVKPSLSNNTPNSSSRDPNSLKICFNCEDIGHHFKDCTAQVKRIFCHGCGEKDVYLPQCSKCRPGNLNYYVRGRLPGTIPSHNQSNLVPRSQQQNSGGNLNPPRQEN